MPLPDFEPLFTPFRIGGITLPNRIVFPPMGLQICEDGVPSAAAMDYYARRATGGAGLVITEGAYIDHPASGDNPVLGRFHGESCLTGWGKTAERVHAAGAFVMPELWHVGLIYHSADVLAGKPRFRPELGLVGPSGYIEPGKLVGEPMTQLQIDDVIAAFGRGAAQATALGFDGVEIHGAHGFLIDQFLWSQTNKRADRYGGTAASRGRFGAEVVTECRRNLKPGMPILMRLSQFKIIDYTARMAETPQELADLLAPMVDAGVDVFDCSERRFWEPAFEGSDLNLAGWVKKLTGKPTITIGSVGLDTDMMSSFATPDMVSQANLRSLDQLMERFGRGEFDLVGIGRAMIAEPDWPHIVRRGDLHALKPYSVAAIENATALFAGSRE